jgi:flavin-dependent thymidylate synthase
MKIRLAGFNVDTDLFKRLNLPKDVPLTPETLSAAYARISRSPLAIPQLRKQACRDVIRARQSNQTIIFEMGHHSVAEHAVFNLDIMGVSRLALEEIERFRLASFTEKSQRYVTLKGDFVIPDEIRDPRLRKTFVEMVGLQNDLYRRCFERLREDLIGRYPELAARSSSRRLLEGRANEDARYILSLATAGQVGVTINARNLEHLFRRFSLSPLKEVRKLGRKVFALIEPVAPSLILFPRPSAFDAGTYSDIERMLKPEAEVDEPGLGEKP